MIWLDHASLRWVRGGREMETWMLFDFVPYQPYGVRAHWDADAYRCAQVPSAIARPRRTGTDGYIGT